ncbi:trans-resveratrol di-O-methyltransferase-like isoform X2 [Chenopodium quinoa]|nr:trans-resveratrol di-O-methyltransferase-like isoform X2 [Chenopodium quinoa]
MDPMGIPIEPAKELLSAQTHVWNHIFSYLSPMALKCAIQLGIPDAIQKHGKPMTLTELATSLSLHPNKALSLGRLMRLLVHSNFFSKQILSSSEEAFDLTVNSKLLLKDHPLTLAPFALMVLDPIFFELSHNFSRWFQNEDDNPFHTAHRKSIWEYISCAPEFNKLFSDAMASDTQFVVSLLMSKDEFKGLLEGVKSLVDVGDGNGAMAKAIANLFPELMCVVFDLPHVVQGSTWYGKNPVYVGGDMFEAVPPAQVALLKFILHNWSDEHCIKILERCKEAIPSKGEGGKIIIIDIVVENNNDNSIPNYLNSQLLLDLQMMNTGGKERTEEEWRKLFISAGLNDYKIFRNLGSRSVIEVYPLQVFIRG